MSGEPAADGDGAAVTRVLVVDDNEANRDMLARRLRRRGFEAGVAEDGPAALRAVSESDYDVVLLDVMMPGMSGVEVLEKIRETRGKTDLPVIMATAKTDSADVVKALELGANDYVTKPIEFPVLVARLEAQLGIRDETKQQVRAALDVSRGLSEGVVIDERYEIVSLVGQGGFAAVYEAIQLSTGQRVAFKHLHPDRALAESSDVEVERFIQEMKVIGSLDHPSIVRLIDSGEIRVTGAGGWHEGPPPDADEPTLAVKDARQKAPTPSGSDSVSVPYIVMEFLEGRTLASVLAGNTALPSAEAVDLALPILSALSVAHEQDVIHRDIKPGNIFLVKDPKGNTVPKVLDFGIAKLVSREGDLTVDESFIGTPEYMSPEQGVAAKDLDHRADQFSVAAILYQTLTGHRLYQANTLVALVRLVTTAGYETPSALGVELPDGLEAVLLRALSAERDRRFSSVESFGKALLPFASDAGQRRWQDAFEVPTDPPPPNEPKSTVRLPGTMSDEPSSGVMVKAPDTGRRSQQETVRSPLRKKSGAPPWAGMAVALLVLAAILAYAFLTH